MRKKMKLFIAMVSVGALLGTMPVMAAEQPELPTKVQDIANGSDELYGEGVPIEHGTNPDERFSSGGVDHTHQYIVANALKILSNDNMCMICTLRKIRNTKKRRIARICCTY